MRFLPIAALALIFAGCSGKGSDDASADDGGDDDDNPVVETIDTSGPDTKTAAEVRFKAFIAWDATQQQVVSPIIDGQDTFISAYIISLYEAGWNSAVEDSFCEVVVNIEGLPGAPTATAEGFIWGIDIPAGDKEVFTDCLEKGFDPNQWTKGDPLVEWGPFDWRLRLGGTLSDELIDWLTPDTPTKDWDIAQFMAGDWSSEEAPFSADPDDNYWYAYAMDGKHNVDLDHRLQDTEMVPASGQPATAYFIWDQRVYWNLDEEE